MKFSDRDRLLLEAEMEIQDPRKKKAAGNLAKAQAAQASQGAGEAPTPSEPAAVEAPPAGTPPDQAQATDAAPQGQPAPAPEAPPAAEVPPEKRKPKKMKLADPQTPPQQSPSPNDTGVVTEAWDYYLEGLRMLEHGSHDQRAHGNRGSKGMKNVRAKTGLGAQKAKQLAGAREAARSGAAPGVVSAALKLREKKRMEQAPGAKPTAGIRRAKDALAMAQIGAKQAGMRQKQNTAMAAGSSRLRQEVDKKGRKDRYIIDPKSLEAQAGLARAATKYGMGKGIAQAHKDAAMAILVKRAAGKGKRAKYARVQAEKLRLAGDSPWKE